MKASQPMTILLLGKNGQVGWELQRSLSPLGVVTAMGHAEADLTDLSTLKKTIQTVRPHVIVNAAAYTAVDRAETETQLAHTINALAPEVMAQEAAKINALLVHYSTDYVFDGSGNQAWSEDDNTAPLNVYGSTKREGEWRIAQHHAKHLIFRTSWVYAARGGNFAKTMLRLAQERDALKVIDDQIGAPTGAELLADVTAHAIGQTLDNPERAGLYHLSSAGHTSWHGYACHVLKQAQRSGMTLKATAERVEAVASSAFVTAAQRPQNSRLNCDKLQSTFSLTLPVWQQGVDRMLEELKSN